MTNAMVADAAYAAGYRERILPDGHPRTLEQVGELDVILVGPEPRWTRLLRSRPTLKRSSHGCLTAQSLKLPAPTTPKRSFVVGWRSIQSRPNLSPLSTVRKAKFDSG